MEKKKKIYRSEYFIDWEKCLITFMKERNLTINELVWLSGFSRRTLYNWLGGTQPRKLSNILQLKNFFENNGFDWKKFEKKRRKKK